MQTPIIGRETETGDDSRFDRLVDGTLSAAEYRALLASLDDEPGAWRRCALAFLEAQALRQECAALCPPQRLQSPQLQTARPQASAAARLWPFLAIAASFLIALGVGLALPRFLPRDEQDISLAGNHPAAPDVRHEVLRPIGNMRLVVNGPDGEQTEAGDLPVYEASAGAERYLQPSEPVLSSEVVEMLERRGHSIEHSAELYPVRLDDGRQLIVPVERYHITPVRLTY